MLFHERLKPTAALPFSWVGKDCFRYQFHTNAETILERVVVKRNRMELGYGTQPPTHYQRVKPSEVARLDLDDSFKGAELVRVSADAPPDRVIAALFKTTALAGAKVTTHKVLNSCWAITGAGTFLNVDVDTNLGRRSVNLQYDSPRIGGAPRGWWCWISTPSSLAGSPVSLQ
jgi:hypothetical protein